MDQFTVGEEPGSERNAEDVPQTVVEVVDESSNNSVAEPAAAGEKEATAIGIEQEPAGIVKTPRSFEDGIQHTTDPQKLEEDKETQKYTF